MAELDRAAISERLQQSRTLAGITQEQMADLMRVHVNSVQNWESLRHTTVPFDRLEEWASLTGTSKAWLLQGDEATQLEADVREELQQVRRTQEELLEEIRWLRDELRGGGGSSASSG